jgi:hypothetical protein
MLAIACRKKLCARAPWPTEELHSKRNQNNTKRKRIKVLIQTRVVEVVFPSTPEAAASTLGDVADDTSTRSNSFPVAAHGTSKSSGSDAKNHTKLDGAIQHESLRWSPVSNLPGRASAHSRLSVPDLRRGNSAHQGDEALDRHLAPPTTARTSPSTAQQRRIADRPLNRTVLARTKLHPTPRNKADLHVPNLRLQGVESGPGYCASDSRAATAVKSSFLGLQ